MEILPLATSGPHIYLLSRYRLSQLMIHGAFICALLMSAIQTLYADEIKIAVASNFSPTMTVISRQFEKSTGHKVKLIPGSTGKHYAQIHHGAPFDLFFAADRERPQRLEEEGLAIVDSRFTYAIGKVVLWSPDKHLIDSQGKVLQQDSIRYLAIANPKLAPYGIAARQILQKIGLWQHYQGRLVRGENIAQTYQFVKTGNATLGFVAYSQIKADSTLSGSYWIAPQDLYTPIEQQAILLKDTPAARAFMTFMRLPEIIVLIKSRGYELPE